MVMESEKVKIYSQIDNYSKTIVILAVILLSCLASSLMILSNVRNFPEEYDLLIFLPLSFCICSFIFIEAIRMLLKSVSVSLVLGTLYVRNVILPVIMAYGGCSTYANADKIYQYISQAVLLLIYEQAVIFAVIYFACKKSYVTTVPNLPTELKIDEIKFKKTGVLKLALFIMCTLVFAAFINYPQLRYYFTFLLSSQIDSVNNQNLNFLYMNTTVPGYVYWPVTYIMEVLRIILPALILIKIRMGIKTKRKEALAVLVSLVISFVFAAIMGPTKAISIFLAICFSIMLTLFYPNKYKRMNMIIMLSILFLGVVGLFISSRINGSDSLIAMEETSTMLQAYFGGVGNVANAMAVRQQFSLNILFTDILGSIAFVSCIFKNAISTPAIFNYAIYDSAAYCDQIIPMVGQGYFYFSYVLAPILSCAVTFIAMKCEKKANREINLFKRFTLIFLCVMFSVSPVIYNLNIVISITTTYILPVYALSLLIGKVKA